jgi:hypothetical protein
MVVNGKDKSSTDKNIKILSRIGNHLFQAVVKEPYNPFTEEKIDYKKYP